MTRIHAGQLPTLPQYEALHHLAMRAGAGLVDHPAVREALYRRGWAVSLPPSPRIAPRSKLTPTGRAALLRYEQKHQIRRSA